MDKDPHLYHKNMDTILDMYEANHEDSDNDDSSSNIVYSDVFVYMATLDAVSAALYVLGSPTLLLDDTLINK